MAKPKTYPRLTREAADPTTAPARLDYLSRHHDPTVRRLALANPALPGARLTEALRLGYPPAWGNPAALWALLEMPPADAQEGAVRAVTELARCRKRTAAAEPPHVVTETMASLLRPHMLAAWEDCAVGGRMLHRIARYAQSCGALSSQHHRSTLLTCLVARCNRIVYPAGSDGPRDDEADEAEAWARSGETDMYKAGELLRRARWKYGNPARHSLIDYAVTCSPDIVQRDGLFSCGAPVADILRAAMPVPMWLDELTPPPPVAPRRT